MLPLEVTHGVLRIIYIEKQYYSRGVTRWVYQKQPSSDRLPTPAIPLSAQQV